MALSAGEVAPDATVFKGPREPIHLHDFKGKTLVMMFFPMAFSSTCTEEMCSIAEDYSAWSDLGAEVIGISVDSPYTNVAFAKSCNASFPIVSDFNKEATVKYGVYREDLGGLRGVSERAAFVVDPRGRIAYSWVGENPGVFPPMDEIKAAVRKAG